MMSERVVLLVVHTGRADATETARRVEKVLGDNGIGLRVLSAEAVDRGSLRLDPTDLRDMGLDIEVVDANDRAAEGCRSACSRSLSRTGTSPRCDIRYRQVGDINSAHLWQSVASLLR